MGVKPGLLLIEEHNLGVFKNRLKRRGRKLHIEEIGDLKCCE
jgi:hypothetical protein